jgi:hypothetical protein
MRERITTIAGRVGLEWERHGCTDKHRARRFGVVIERRWRG